MKLLFIGILISFSTIVNAQKNIEGIKKSIVKILGYDNKGYIGTGTGFVIDENNIVTNYHVAEYCTGIQVVTINNDTITSNMYTTVSYDSDLISLYVPNHGLKPLKISDKGGKVGEAIYSIGFPAELSYQFTKGIINNIIENKEGLTHKILVHNLDIDFGASGSPILNLKNEIVGVITAMNTVTLGGNFNYGVEISSINNLINHPKVVKYPLSSLRWNTVLNDDVYFYDDEVAKGLETRLIQVKNTRIDTIYKPKTFANIGDTLSCAILYSNTGNQNSINTKLSLDINPIFLEEQNKTNCIIVNTITSSNTEKIFVGSIFVDIKGKVTNTTVLDVIQVPYGDKAKSKSRFEEKDEILSYLGLGGLYFERVQPQEWGFFYVLLLIK
jgi:hypothetical protein